MRTVNRRVLSCLHSLFFVQSWRCIDVCAGSCFRAFTSSNSVPNSYAADMWKRKLRIFLVINECIFFATFLLPAVKSKLLVIFPLRKIVLSFSLSLSLSFFFFCRIETSNTIQNIIHDFNSYNWRFLIDSNMMQL